MRPDRSNDPSLQRFRALADLFDNAFRIPGTNWRFGIDPILGLIPGLGDIISAVFAVWSVLLARKLGAPGVIQIQMLANIGVDMLGGAVPIVGDLFDAAFKAHARNRRLLDEWLIGPEAATAVAKRRMLVKPIIALIAVALIGLAAAGVTIWLAIKALGWLMASAPTAGI